MDATALLERRKYEQMWTFAEYRDDHVTTQAKLAFERLGIQGGESLIDFGAGAGYASKWFQDAGVRTLAIDIAANAMAPEIAARVPLLVGSMWDMPVELHADWGFCCDVMEHIPGERVDDVLQFVRKSTRRSTFFSIALRPDGCGRLIGDSLHLTVQPLEWWLERIAPYWNDVRVLRHEPGVTVDFVASNRPPAVAPAQIEEVHGILSREQGQPRQFNYERMAYVAATLDSARYMVDHMLGAVDLGTASRVRAHALAATGVHGLVMEFGVFDGASIREIAAIANQPVHGFDSFEGLPEDWTHFQKKGRFSLNGQVPEGLPANVALHKGWFDATLPGFLAAHPGPVQFVNIDCDLYGSTRTVLSLLGPRIVPGTVIVFDEYLNYPGWQQHEQKAFAEFVAATGRRYEYLGFASSEFAVSVRIV